MQVLVARMFCKLRLQRMGRSVFAFSICALFAMTLTAGAQTGADPLSFIE